MFEPFAPCKSGAVEAQAERAFLNPPETSETGAHCITKLLLYLPWALLNLFMRAPKVNHTGACLSLSLAARRYADLMLDAMIAVLIFFFPGGFNIQSLVLQ